MTRFKDVEALEAWLEPMDYAGFWYALAPFGVDAQTHAHCDEQIRLGADAQIVLDVMKNMVRIELTRELGLKRRSCGPMVRVVAGQDEAAKV